MIDSVTDNNDRVAAARALPKDNSCFHSGISSLARGEFRDELRKEHGNRTLTYQTVKDDVGSHTSRGLERSSFNASSSEKAASMYRLSNLVED